MKYLIIVALCIVSFSSCGVIHINKEMVDTYNKCTKVGLNTYYDIEKRRIYCKK